MRGSDRLLSSCPTSAESQITAYGRSSSKVLLSVTLLISLVYLNVHDFFFNFSPEGKIITC